MSNIYLTEQGSYLKKEYDRIICEKDGETLLERPLKDVGTVVIFGNVQVSVQAMLALLEAGCDIALLSQSGHFRGRVVSALGKNITLRYAQYQRYEDAAFRLSFSRAVTAAKIANGARMLTRYHYSASNPVRMESLDDMKSLEEEAKNASSLDSLRGVEGAAANFYFRDFARALTGDIIFPGRKYYPATDPVNAVLSFGYSFVARELQGLIEAEGLDPFLGFLHEISYGRASLPYDILEEFRSYLVDRLTLKLFNKKILEEEDFDLNRQNGAYYLKRESLKIFVKHYEETVNEPNALYGGVRHTWRHVFRNQIAALKKAIADNGQYQPFRAEE